MSWRLPLVIVLAIVAVGALAPAVQSLPLGVAPALTYPPSETRSYPVHDLTGQTLRTQAWRIVNNTGNCCENHLMTTPDGRIMDVGGDAVYMTADEGRNWTVASPLLQVSGEGSIAYAPNGDILAIIWDPYSGDRLTAMKLPAGETRWQTAQVALHRPFYDRPWLSIAPGPFDVAGTTYPYAALFFSNFNVGSPTENTFVSLDGLTYVPSVRNTLGGGPIARTVQPAEPWADWVQPAGHARIAPLPGGGALSTTGCPWERFDLDLRWRCLTPRDNAHFVPSIVRFDSLGRLHLLQVDRAADTLRYRLSTDGGASWERDLTIPKLGEIENLRSADFVVNGALDRAAIALRYLAQGTDKIVAIKIHPVSSATPTVEVLQVGDGDRRLGSALGGSFRMDFVSIAMLPDGRIVTSFADARHHPPAIAIELP